MKIEWLMKQSYDSTVRGLLHELDLHGPGEGEHAVRVAVYAVAVGERLGLNDLDLIDLRWAALLHDVGKLAVDQNVIRKFGVLSDEEFAMMRLHCAMAEEFVSSLPWLDKAAGGIRHHHERWDGNGYPDGLAGEAIPMFARIIALAEAFDLIAHGSHWREPEGRKEAIRLLQEEVGRQFDPIVWDEFLVIEPLIQPLGAP